jgi:protein-tyrosine phosphatase
LEKKPVNSTSDLQSPMRQRFVGAADIHSHPLPGIDDGATSMADSVRMLALAARYGTTLMVATPHRYYQGRENTPELLRRLTAEVRAALADTGFSKHIELVAGQEIPLTLHTATELQNGAVLSIGDSGIYALVEPPFDRLPDWMAEALARIVAIGIRPVLAHPERNADVQREPQRVVPLVEAGGLMQLTAMSLTGENGQRALKAAHWLLDHDLITAVASDSHSPTWRPPTMRAAFHALVARYGEPVARQICIDYPTHIASGQPLS